MKEMEKRIQSLLKDTLELYDSWSELWSGLDESQQEKLNVLFKTNDFSVHVLTAGKKLDVKPYQS